MKKNEITDTVDKYFKKIEKSFHRILIHFNDEDIQIFRTEIKELRAFFHLLDMEAGGETHFKITSKMKNFYGYAGIIRNLHLLRQTIVSHFEPSTDKDLVAFIDKLGREINYWEKITKEYVGQQKNFDMDEEQILSRLPGKLRRRSVKEFAGYLSYEIQSYLTRFDEERLNSIRKLLEDLLYNWETLKKYKDKMPEGLRKEEDVRSLVNTLLDFRDKCAAYTISETYYNDSGNDEEKVILANIMQLCKTQKEDLQKTIYARMGHIQVNPVVKRAFSF